MRKYIVETNPGKQISVKANDICEVRKKVVRMKDVRVAGADIFIYNDKGKVLGVVYTLEPNIPLWQSGVRSTGYKAGIDPKTGKLVDG